MAATHSRNSTPSVPPVLYIAFELSNGQWKLASSTARGQRARIVSVPARDTARVLKEIARAKTRFGLPESTAVVSCYEAGRDGFWLHRFLHHHGINNVIVDSSSIEVNRRLGRANSSISQITVALAAIPFARLESHRPTQTDDNISRVASSHFSNA